MATGTIMAFANDVAQRYFDTTYDYYGFETKNIQPGADGYVSILIAPGAGRVQLKYTKDGTTTTHNFDNLETAGSLLTATTTKTVSGVDLNNYKTGGTYYFTTGCSNVPGTYFLCTVINHGTDFAWQVGFRASAPTVLFFRTWASSAWTDWQSIATMFAYKDYTVSLGNIAAYNSVQKSQTITVSGYVPYAIRSYELSDDHLIPYGISMNSTTLFVKAKNYDSSAVSSATITVRVAYVKSPANVTQLT